MKNNNKIRANKDRVVVGNLEFTVKGPKLIKPVKFEICRLFFPVKWPKKIIAKIIFKPL